MPCLVSLTGQTMIFSPSVGLLGLLLPLTTPARKAGPGNVEALVCKTGLSGFESRRYLHSLRAFVKTNHTST